MRANVRSSRTKEALAREVWSLHRRLFAYERPHFDRIIASFGLSPSDYRILLALSGRRSRSMGELADLWSCDASTVTWIVGRATRKGYVERTTDPTDRRVRVVKLTPVGAKTRTELFRALDTPPEILDVFSRDDLLQLLDVLSKLALPAPDEPARQHDTA